MTFSSIREEQYVEGFRLWILAIYLFLPIHGFAAEQIESGVELYAGRSCGSCESIEKALRSAGIKYTYYDTDVRENYARLAGKEQEFKQEATELPAILYDGKIVSGRESVLANIPEIVRWQKAALGASATVPATSGVTGIQAPAAIAATTPATVQDLAVREKYQRLDLLAVGLAGLADGVNPCAFATLAFLMGCLLGSGRQRALLTGLSFAAGVFVTYFLAGLGAFRVLFALQGFHSLRAVFHITALALTAGLALLVLGDAARMYLTRSAPLIKLPERLRLTINAKIARGSHQERWLVGGFVLGGSVSLLELACTGQIYLPTILYMLESGATGLTAYGYLLLYNLLFIAPLLVVLALCARGMAAERLWAILRERAALARLLLGGVLALMFLALWIRP